MNILVVHNYYQIRGGEDECFEAEVSLLREQGHTVDVHAANNDQVVKFSPVDIALGTVWSQSTYETIQQRLAQFPYDLVHVHNFFPLVSPAVYYAAGAHHVPVIQTLHNYRLLCPSATLFRNNTVCEACLGQVVPWPGVMYGCYRESRATSAIVATMIASHRLLRTWTQKVDTYIALTEFARSKFIQGGLPAEKIVVKPNFVPSGVAMGQGQGGFALFVGRLSPEKGVNLLLDAWQTLNNTIPLKIVGDGPLAADVSAKIAHLPHVEWLGRKPLDEVHALLQQATVLVFPSIWYEGLPRTIIEALAAGTPVIAGDLGSMSSLIQPGQTGLHFAPGDATDLAAKVTWAFAHPRSLAQMRQLARLEFERKYTATANYHQLIDIYTAARTNQSNQ
jgi:glycosyltransferase involved in cell wall biosynthesis